MTVALWTYSWPTEPGWYWYYGDPYSLQNEPRHVYMRPVKASKGQNAMMFVTEGQFMYKSVAGPDGVWTKMNVPDDPQ